MSAIQVDVTSAETMEAALKEHVYAAVRFGGKDRQDVVELWAADTEKEIDEAADRMSTKGEVHIWSKPN